MKTYLVTMVRCEGNNNAVSRIVLTVTAPCLNQAHEHAEATCLPKDHFYVAHIVEAPPNVPDVNVTPPPDVKEQEVWDRFAAAALNAIANLDGERVSSECYVVADYADEMMKHRTRCMEERRGQAQS